MMGQAATCSPSVSATRPQHVRAFETHICKTSFLALRRRRTPYPSRAIVSQSIHTRLVTEHLWQGGDVGIASIRQTCEHQRRHARMLDPLGEVTPCIARNGLPLPTTQRASAPVLKWKRFRAAYADGQLTAHRLAHPQPVGRIGPISSRHQRPLLRDRSVPTTQGHSIEARPRCHGYPRHEWQPCQTRTPCQTVVGYGHKFVTTHRSDATIRTSLIQFSRKCRKRL